MHTKALPTCATHLYSGLSGRLARLLILPCRLVQAWTRCGCADPHPIIWRNASATHFDRSTCRLPQSESFCLDQWQVVNTVLGMLSGLGGKHQVPAHQIPSFLMNLQLAGSEQGVGHQSVPPALPVQQQPPQLPFALVKVAEPMQVDELQLNCCKRFVMKLLFV